MTKSVRVMPSGVEFLVHDDKTILESALSYNINLDYSCANGRCGKCKADLLSGEVSVASDRVSFVSEHRLNKNEILTCCTNIVSDVVIDAELFLELGSIKIRTVAIKVNKISFVNDVLILILRMPPTSKFQFLPGQYIDLICNGVKRSYSIANSSPKENQLELHIKKVEGGVLSSFLFSELRENQLLRFKGPLGTFYLRDSNRPLAFLCTGTGFAPVKSMVESLIESKSSKKIFIFWGGRFLKDIYTDLPFKWVSDNENIQFYPVLSREKNNKYASGYVQNAAVDILKNLSGFDVYACGSTAMINDSVETLLNHGLDLQHFYSDAFVSSN